MQLQPLYFSCIWEMQKYGLQIQTYADSHYIYTLDGRKSKILWEWPVSDFLKMVELN